MVSYLIKSIVCSGLLLVVYHFILEREKMLRFNRFYLLLAMVFALLVPLATIDMSSQVVEELAPDNIVNVPTVHTAAVNAPLPVLQYDKPVIPDYLPWLAYGIISTVLLLRIGIQILTVLRSKSGRRIIPFETAKLVLMPDDTPTYSFFNFIFISQKAFDFEAVPKEILAHELAHSKQAHSIDILFTELLLAFCWFNPLFLLYRRAIRLNHEYLADDAVLAGPTGVGEYQLLLLNTLLSHRTTTLASSFNYPVTKKRLAMMTTKINLRNQFIKKALVALLLPVLAFALAEKTYSQQPATETIPKSEKGVNNAPVTGNAAVSEEEMKDFLALVEKHTRHTKSRKGRIDPIVSMSPEQENQLYATYERMSDVQKERIKANNIAIFRMDVPVKKAPEPDMFENWKKPHIFGIWLNGTHVPNTVLNKYNTTDIAEYTLHRLVGKGLVGKGYKYQLELTTNDEFDRTIEQRMNNRIVLARVTWFDPPKVKAGTKK
ncbi:M56 family metallopeptidase [Dyadobacter sp. 22481]|uniref:M56 family metallopeptidase n=1 Tax=Dyadobacter sp. 22481 TaxID=3453926 RepID=UPI003F83C984